MLSCNAAFMKAGSMGLSILFASGDQGVCGREGCGFLKHKFHPDFPAASPYITAVGGTDFETKGVIGAETAWSAGGARCAQQPEPSSKAQVLTAMRAWRPRMERACWRVLPVAMQGGANAPAAMQEGP